MHRCDWFFNSCGRYISIYRCFGELFPLRSAVARFSLLLCFLIVGFYASGISIPTSLVDIRTKSYVNRPFDPACLSVRITINKLYLIPELVVSESAETVEVWARACRMSPCCSLILSCNGLPVSLMYSVNHLV